MWEENSHTVWLILVSNGRLSEKNGGKVIISELLDVTLLSNPTETWVKNLKHIKKYPKECWYHVRKWILWLFTYVDCSILRLSANDLFHIRSETTANRQQFSHTLALRTYILYSHVYISIYIYIYMDILYVCHVRSPGGASDKTN